MKKSIPDWVEAFAEYTSPSGTPLRLRRWAGIACVAGAMERKIWVKTAGAKLYPNLYVFLVSPPGKGKSRAINAVRDMWKTLPDHKVAPSNVSKASLIDDLADGHRTLIVPGSNPPTYEFHSLLIASLELGVLLPEYANDFMNTMTDLYDGYHYSERKRTKNLQISIAAPNIHMLAGTTPDYLSNLLPAGAWDQGFLSRVIMVYGAETIKKSMFTNASFDPAKESKLKQDFLSIGEAFGELSFTDEVKDAFDSWYLGDQAPVPDHPKLKNYCTRRPAHLLKLMMVSCINRNTDLTINIENFQQALDWLVDAETSVPDIFKDMASGGDERVMEEVWHFLYQYQARFPGKFAPQALVYRFVAGKVPAYNIENILSMMEKSNMLTTEAIKGVGMVYKPKDKGALYG